MGGRVDTTALINNKQNSIVAEFCCWVHAVIWNCCLFKIKSGKLGLANKVQANDRVCILYRCTVPVILSCNEKKEKDLEEEKFEDRAVVLKSCIKKMVKRCECKANAMKRVKQYSKEDKAELNAAKDATNYKLETER